MWRTTLALVGLLATVACSGGGQAEPPPPTFSPSFWSLEVCRRPLPVPPLLIAPEFDIRFDPERAAMNPEHNPQEWTEALLDMTIRNYGAMADYLDEIHS